MSIFFGNQAFAKRKELTEPIVKLPKTMQDVLNIYEYHQDGIFKIEPKKESALYDSCYVFEDINYINKDDGIKDKILVDLMKWLNSMSVDFKISIANEFRDMERYIESLFGHVNKKKYPVIEAGIRSVVEEKIDDGEANTSRMRYLTITCRASSFKEAKLYFNTLDTQLIMNFNLWGSRIRKLNGVERLSLLRSFFRSKENDTIESKNFLDNKYWKNGIMPTSIKQVSKEVMLIDDTYVSILYAREYGETLDEGKVMHGFANLDFPSYVTLDIAPINRPTLKDKLAAAHIDVEKSIELEMQAKANKGMRFARPSYRKGKRDEELEDYRKQVDNNNEKAFFIGLLVIVTALTEEDLYQRLNQIELIGRENEVYLESYNYHQLEALNTALPFGGRQVNVMRSFLSSSAVALQPYYAQDIQQLGGFIYGINRTTKRVILIDRRKGMNPHGILVGHSGSGKSMLIKLTEVAQTLLATDDDLFIIDPQNEFKSSCEEFGGVFFDFTPKGEIHLNALEIPLDILDDPLERESFIARQVEFANAFASATMKNIVITSEHENIIEHAVNLMYEEVFHASKFAQPTFKDLRRHLKVLLDQADNHSDKANIRQIYNSLERYCDGTYDLFAKETNINTSNRFVTFGLKHVPEPMWEVAMVTIMNFLSTRMEYNQRMQRATRFIVDEAQVVCQSESSARQLLKTILTFRKFGGIVTLSLQNLKTTIENQELRDMFQNCEYKCFLDQGGVNAEALAQIQDLSSTEFQALSESGEGTEGKGVVVWQNKVILFDMRISKENPLYKLFSTNFHERATGTYN